MWRNLLKANIAYAIGSAANSVALLLLVPFLVNALNVEEYGAWALYEVAILLLYMIVMAGLDVGFMREYWFLESEEERRRLTGTILLVVTLWGGILVGVGLGLLIGGLKLSLPGAPYTVLEVMLVAWAEAVFMLLLTLFRIREKAAAFVMLSAVRLFLFMSMAIAFVQSGYGVTGALGGRLVATVIMLGVALGISKRFISVRLDKRILKRVARYGLPLLPANLSGYILLASDRYVLQHFSTLESLAIYSFAYKIATILDVLITRPFATDWAPRRFKLATSTGAPGKYAQVLVLYLFVAIGFALLIIAVTPTLYTWFAPSVYQAGLEAVPVILLAYLIYGLSYPLNVGIMLKDRTHYLPIIGWLAAAACLILNFWWIPAYGMMGAAWATVVAYSVWSVGIAWGSLRIYPIPYSLRQVLWVVATGGLGYGGLWALDHISTIANPVGTLVLKAIWVILVLTVSGYWIWRAALMSRRAAYEVQLEMDITSSQ